MNLNNEINLILSNWNPIGVPSELAPCEYESYVVHIIATNGDLSAICLLLEKMISVDMGLDFDRNDSNQERDLLQIAKLLESKIRGNLNQSST